MVVRVLRLIVMARAIILFNAFFRVCFLRLGLLPTIIGALRGVLHPIIIARVIILFNATFCFCFVHLGLLPNIIAALRGVSTLVATALVTTIAVVPSIAVVGVIGVIVVIVAVMRGSLPSIRGSLSWAWASCCSCLLFKCSAGCRELIMLP